MNYVGVSPAHALPATGIAVSALTLPLAIVGLVAILVGVALVIISVRRQRHDAALAGVSRTGASRNRIDRS